MREIEDLLGPALDCDLHHYTGVAGLHGIATSRSIWASSAYYLNDSSEIMEAVRFTSHVAYQMAQSADEGAAVVLDHLQAWLKTLQRPQGIYVLSLSSKENDLSQWRAYTPYTKGVCLSFSSDQILSLARSNGCKVVKCIYSEKEKTRLAKLIVEKTLETWRSTCEDDIPKAHPSQKYHPLFESMKSKYLALFVLFKDQRFSSEGEWRIVSPYIASYVEERVDYRVGASIMIPFIKIDLPSDGPLFDRVWIGPTEHNNLSMHAISAFLSKYRLVRSGCISSGIPYREWR